MRTDEWVSGGGTQLESYYRDLLEEHEGSGLSVAAFAEETGLSAATLYAWRRRLGRAGADSRGVKLVEVCVTESDGAREGTGRMSVTIADGTRIELDADFDESALKRLLGVLAPC